MRRGRRHGRIRADSGERGGGVRGGGNPVRAGAAAACPRTLPLRIVSGKGGGGVAGHGGGKADLYKRSVGRFFDHSQYPDRKVFVDRRSDFYGPDFSKGTLHIWNARHNWQAHLDQYGVDAVLVPPAAPLAAAIEKISASAGDVDDGFAIVFRPVNNAAPGDADSSVVGSSNGPGRDRGSPKSQACDPTITTKTDNKS